MTIYENGVAREATAEEIAEFARQKQAAEKIVIQMTPAEVLRLLVPDKIAEVPDDTAKRMIDYFETWESRIGTEAAAGERLTYNGVLYKCRQAHTISEAWNPKDTPALWANVSEESQEADGSREHPYAWEQGMTSYEGKYYTENGILYLCTRDSGNPLYFPISSLIGTYFQIAE